jgi:SAM-dependent methyltransferase
MCKHNKNKERKAIHLVYETVSVCPVCAGGEVKKVVSVKEYKYLKCAGCSAYYLAHRLPEAEMLKLYSDPTYYRGGAIGYCDYLSQGKALSKTYADLLSAAASVHPIGGDFLDVGCAYGFMFPAAGKYFTRLSGTEMLPGVESYIHRRKPDIDIYREIPADREFDCIALMQVIEHVYDPVCLLKRLKKSLKKCGVLLLSTPYADGFWFRLFGKNWPLYKAPEHVVLYNRAALGELLKQAGFAKATPLAHRQYFTVGSIAEKLKWPLPKKHSQILLNLPETSLSYLCQ